MATDISTAEGVALFNWLNARIGQTLDRGECWDAAERAIRTVGAPRPTAALYVWGRAVAVSSARVGDVLQFSNFVVRVTQADGSFQENSFGMPMHTAVVSYLNVDGSVDMLHQNYNYDRSVQSLEYVFLRNITAGGQVVTTTGSVTCYRPQKP